MLEIAFRNVLRNGRHSLMTGLAIAVGASALILLGGYNNMLKVGMETGIIRGLGHLAVFEKGYFEFGSGQPAAYSISGYQAVIDIIRNDPKMKPLITVVTPRVSLGGIAGNAEVDKSKTFFGSGFVPSDQDKMNAWDEYGLAGAAAPSRSGLADGDDDHGIIGIGLARILGFCKPLKIANCPAGAPNANSAQLQLLSGAGGAPNIVSLKVKDAKRHGAKEMDDSYVGMNLKLAQQLMYGGGEHKAISIVVQLKRTEDIPRARARLNALFATHRLNLEVRDYTELYPSFKQILGYFLAMFAFIAVVMGIIVTFTIANTMGMSVMERTNEIGTARAMGVRRWGIHRQFLLEGAILGMFGATAGILLGALLSSLINCANITYTPPSSSSPVQLYLLTQGNEGFLLAVWIVLVVVSTLASIVPANRAARMKVVDALRHV